MTEKTKEMLSIVEQAGKALSGLELWIQTPDPEKYFGINRQDPMITRSDDRPIGEILEEIAYLFTRMQEIRQELKSVTLLMAEDVKE